MSPNLLDYQIEPYRTPDGMVDFPFSYVYDATRLTDGQNYQNIQIPIQGDSNFILRSIKGVNLCVAAAASAGKFSYRNASQSYANAQTSSGIIATKNWPVLPEKLYPYNSQISIDLWNVSRDFTTCVADGTIYNSFIAFQGVKRFAGGAGNYSQALTPYKFYRKPQSFEYSLTIDWPHFTTSGAANPYHRFIQQMDNFDFELLGVRIAQSGHTSPLLTNDFQITIYDRHMNATSSAPLNQYFLNSARQTPQTAPLYRTAWPSPVLVYPAGSQITFDVVSMLCSTNLPQTYTISFVGIWRLPA